jgi:hypothetical protein
MAPCLAYAEPTDLSDSNWQVMLVILAAIAAVVVLVLVPIGVARRRGSRWAGGIVVASLLWGVLTAASVACMVLMQYQRERDRNLDLRTGYAPAPSPTGAPSWPWGLWLILAAVYGALLAAGYWGRARRESAGPTRLPPH